MKYEDDFIRNRIKQLMLAKGWTYYGLGKAANISASTVTNWFTNQDSEPSTKVLMQICEAFGITMSELWSNGEVVELQGEKKELLEEWVVLDPGKRKIILDLIKEINHPNDR